MSDPRATGGPGGAVGVLVVADTHLHAGTLDRMPDEVWQLARDADVVVHAGDVVTQAVLDAFAAITPTEAVLGNNDTALVGRLPEERHLVLGGATVAVVHDSGATAGRERRMARRFPDAEVVVFGHSHTPVVQRSDAGPLLLNPGSPTQRRRQPVHTVGWLELGGGEVRDARIIEVGARATVRP